MTVKRGSLFVEKVSSSKYAMDFPASETMPVENYTKWLEEGKVPQYVYEIAKVRPFCHFIQ